MLEHFYPLFVQIARCQWVSFCPDGVSFCPEYHPKPLFFSQPSHTPFGDCAYTKHPQAHPKTPLFLA